MSGVRIVVSITGASAEAVDQALPGRVEACRAKSAEEGCLQYEIFRSAMRPERMVLLEHWESRAAYDVHWTTQVAREGLPPPRPGAAPAIEIYPHQTFVVENGIWVPADPDRRSRTILWP